MCSIRRVWFCRTCLPLTSLMVWILFFAVPTIAAESSGMPLSVDWLVEEVVSRNAGLTAVQLRAQAKYQLIVSVGALDDPRVIYSIAPQSIGDHIPSNFGNALGIRQVVQLSQSIPWPGKRSLRSEHMEAEAEAALFTYEDTRLTLISQSRLLWAQWWYVDEALAVNEEHLRLSAELRVVAETQYSNGIGLQQDVLRIQTHEVQLQHQQIVLEQGRRRLQSSINHILNQAPASSIGPARGEPDVPELPGEEVMRRWLVESHPSLGQLESESNVAKLNMRLIEKDDYPDLQFNLGYNELWNASELRLLVGVSLNIPLDFGKRSSRKAAASYEYHSVLSDIVNLRSALNAELETQLSYVEQADHGIQLIETELLPRAQQTVNAALANYEGGGGNFTALIEAQEVLLDMELLLASSFAERFVAIAEIDRLCGGRLWLAGGER